MHGKQRIRGNRQRNHTERNLTNPRRPPAKRQRNDPESNLDRFWRECKERDEKKRRRIASQMRQGESQFAATVHQLKKDAQLLTSKFDKMIEAQKPIDSNRRHSMFDGHTQIPEKPKPKPTKLTTKRKRAKQSLRPRQCRIDIAEDKNW